MISGYDDNFPTIRPKFSTNINPFIAVFSDFRYLLVLHSFEKQVKSKGGDRSRG